MWSDTFFYFKKVGPSFFLNMGYLTLLHYRMGRWAFVLGYRYMNPFWYLYLLIKIVLLPLTKIELPPTAKIGKRLFLPHAYGLVMGGKVVIGNDCTIGPWVVIGHLRKDGNPVIGNGVYIGPKASLLGDISVGDNVVVGAHALLIESVPANAKVLGAKGIVHAG